MALVTDVETVELTAERVAEETQDAMSAVDDGLSARRVEMRGRAAIALLATRDEGQRVERRHNARRRRTDYLVCEGQAVLAHARREGTLVCLMTMRRTWRPVEARAMALALQLAALDAEGRSA